MKSSEILDCIDHMYKDLPFKSEDGRLIYVSDKFNCLINSCELFDKAIFKQPGIFSVEEYDWFLINTLKYLESIDLNEFKSKSKSLDKSSKEILLRIFDRLNSKFSNISFSEFVLTLI